VAIRLSTRFRRVLRHGNCVFWECLSGAIPGPIKHWNHSSVWCKESTRPWESRIPHDASTLTATKCNGLLTATDGLTSSRRFERWVRPESGQSRKFTLTSAMSLLSTVVSMSMKATCAEASIATLFSTFTYADTNIPFSHMFLPGNKRRQWWRIVHRRPERKKIGFRGEENPRQMNRVDWYYGFSTFWKSVSFPLA
jgi:hypothetical protein